MQRDAVRQPTRSAGVRRLVLLMAGVCCTAAGWSLWRFQTTRPPSETEMARHRAQAPPGMVLVPGGECWIGSNDADAGDDEITPMRRIFVPSYYIDTYEVTNREFRKFDPKHTFPAGQDDLPATHILYDQAEAYAKWAGKRLPTENEWEKAARGQDGRRYPWGNTWAPDHVAQRVKKPGSGTAVPPTEVKEAPLTGKVCRVGPSRMRPVGSVPAGVSPYGCYDMAGNAWEWVQGFYNGNPEQRILRGGAIGYGEWACRSYSRAIEGAADT
jgi:formylglycine-generating enzyme required for sulfatase activity